MKLESFVKQTLLDITNGVANAQKESSLPIAPSSIDGEKIPDGGLQYVSFEVAVTVAKEGGAGIEILSMSLGGNLSSEQAHKISFKVPVYLGLKWVNGLLKEQLKE